jgi:hypothetical protein
MSVGTSLNPDHQMKPSQHVRKRKLTAPEQREREPEAFLPFLARRHSHRPLARLSRNLNMSGILIGNKFTHYAEGPRFCRGPSATGCRTSILRVFEPKVIFGAADSCRRGSTSWLSCFSEYSSVVSSSLRIQKDLFSLNNLDPFIGSLSLFSLNITKMPYNITLPFGT